jgi:multiple sugar transport system ATP-binding protein
VGGLALRGIVKRFGGTPVLDHLSLDIGETEFLVVLGPSGCGKSTLLRVIAGLESIDGGEIEIDGRRVDHLPPGERGVAMVFQGYALYPHMTVRGNIDFGLRNAGMARAEIARRVSDVARTLELEPLLERLPSELSGGQRQRVAIGRALVKDPKVFMFDEPLSNLDAALRSRMRQEIAKLHRRVQTTMIFVTHDQTEAMTLADRIVVMNQRRIEQVGTPLEIYTHPATEFVAGFIGSPAMNLMPVTPQDGREHDTLQLTMSDGSRVSVPLPAGVPIPVGPLKLGFRPESVQLCAAGAGTTQGVVEFIEYLGDRSHVFVSLKSGERLVALGGGSCPFIVDQCVGLRLDVRAAHIFDAGGRNYRTPP